MPKLTMPPARYLKQNLCERPYRLVPLAVFAYFAFGFLIDPHSAFHTLNLYDTDDYMRLDEVVRWLKSTHPFGAGWYDLSQPRLAQGEHVVVHWARLVDLPIAFFMLPFIRALGMATAALTASMIVPPLLFGALMILAPAFARPLVGKHRANLAAAMILFLPAVTFNFEPGRVDHHGWQILIASFGLFALPRLVYCENAWRTAIAAAAVFTCGLWIGAEALPWVILFAANLAWIAAWRGGAVLRNAALFGIAFAVSTLLVLPIALPPDQFAGREITWFSTAYVIFATLTGAVFMIGWLLGRKTETKWLRLVLLAALSFFAAMLFFLFVPAALEGPYANFSRIVTPLILDNVGEAQPFLKALNVHLYDSVSFLHAAPAFLHYMFLPSLALFVIGWNAWRAKAHARLLWIAYGVFLLPAIVLTFFWQLRVVYFAELYALLPALWLLLRAWDWIGARLVGRPRFWAEIAAFALIFPLPVLLIPDAANGARLYPDLALFPVTPTENGSCDLKTASAWLSARDVFGMTPRVVLASINDGPELLLRTPDFVLSAPYNVPANKDVLDFFDAREDAPALAVVKKDKVDLVLVCRSIPWFYAGLGTVKERLHAYLSVGPDGQLRIASSKNRPALIEKLINGKAPGWLKPVEIPGDKGYLLFEVKKPGAP